MLNVCFKAYNERLPAIDEYWMICRNGTKIRISVIMRGLLHENRGRESIKQIVVEKWKEIIFIKDEG